MMKQRRNEYQILAGILRTCETERLKTHIVYQNNLNFNIVRKHLSKLINQDFLKEVRHDGKTFFKTTAKGFNWLMNFQRLRF